MWWLLWSDMFGSAAVVRLPKPAQICARAARAPTGRTVLALSRSVLPSNQAARVEQGFTGLSIFRSDV